MKQPGITDRDPADVVLQALKWLQAVKSRRRLKRLAKHGFSTETLARIAAPAGLPLGGHSPAEIAVAILAQMTQSRYVDK